MLSIALHVQVNFLLNQILLVYIFVLHCLQRLIQDLGEESDLVGIRYRMKFTGRVYKGLSQN